jgi:drug/metabolite transporter (DMT)-like permease
VTRPEEPSDRAADGWPVHLALLAAQLGFALFPIFGKLALMTIPALVLAALRVVSAALVLEGLRRAAGKEEVAKQDRAAVLLYGILGVTLNQLFFILGLSLSTAINTSILTATIPVFTLLAAVLLGRERMTLPAVAGLVLAGAGAFLLLGAHHFEWHSRYTRGNLLLLGNAVCYSFYLVLSRPILSRYSALTIVSRIFLYGSAPIVLVALPALSRFSPSVVTPLSWVSLAAIVAFSTVMPYLVNSWALARTDASRVAFYVFLQPLVATVLAVLILHETFTGRTAVAALLILAGLAVSLTRRPLTPGPQEQDVLL